MSGAVDYYHVLQVDPDADPEVIAAAYRRLAAKYHPDVNAEPDAAIRMREINAAYEVLSDPEQRAAYDRARGVAASQAHARPATTVVRSSGMEGFLKAIIMMVISGVILNLVFGAFAGPGARYLAIAVVVVLLLWKGGPIFRYFSGSGKG